MLLLLLISPYSLLDVIFVGESRNPPVWNTPGGISFAIVVAIDIVVVAASAAIVDDAVVGVGVGVSNLNFLVWVLAILVEAPACPHFIGLSGLAIEGVSEGAGGTGAFIAPDSSPRPIE